jgi:hypothetical protein
VITAAITGAVAAVLALFGIPPGPYLVVVAVVVKAIIVLAGLLLARRLIHRGRSKEADRARAAGQLPPAPASAPRSEDDL